MKCTDHELLKVNGFKDYRIMVCHLQNWCGGHALSENTVFSVYKGNKIRYYMKSNIHVVHVIITVICW